MNTTFVKKIKGFPYSHEQRKALKIEKAEGHGFEP
jgi:hypothetical protein